MERTVNSLLALSRYEAGLEQPQPEPVELCAEVRRVAGLMKAHADQNGLKFDLALPNEFWVHVDTALFRRLVDNLVGNAVEHSPRGSAIRVQLGPNGELRLSNPAPHLSEHDVPRLGERFFHLSSGHGGMHTGLGLSLACAIASVIGLGLEFELRDDGCLVVVVSGLKQLESVPHGADLVT
jgi:signal transduction histidine kinase